MQEQGYIKYVLNSEHIVKSQVFSKRLNNIDIAKSFLPNSFIVSLISQYDVFIGGIIRELFRLCPEMLNSSDKKIELSQIVRFADLEEAKDFVIEKEVETVLRDSHIDQIKWFQNKLSIPLTKDLAIWPDFIELTERRNLFVHSDAVVNRQYLKICSDNEVNLLSDINLGDRLDVSPDYFNNSCDITLEIGVKLAHVIWRKLDPDDRRTADKNLNDTAYSLIKYGNYQLAINLLIFGTDTIKTHSSDEMLLYMMINKAQAYKWNNEPDGCKEILDNIDWSTKDMIYHLVRHVLLDNFPDTYKLMKQIGNNNDVINQFAYQDWPLFKKIRKNRKFKSTYKEIFGEDFSIIEDGHKDE